MLKEDKIIKLAKEIEGIVKAILTTTFLLIISLIILLIEISTIS